MKTSCGVIRDLLPLYADDACSEESRTLVEEHLAECPACAEELARQVRRVPMAKVNLIPLSPVSHRPDFKTPDEPTLLMFLDVLMKHGVQTMLRRSRGKDADAACGQLRLRHMS